MSDAVHRRRRGSGHELRAVVLAVATDLLAREGTVEALTMRDVAAAAGVTAPSVYRHFPDKQALVAAVLIERFAAFTEALRLAAGAADAPAAQRLRAMAHAYVREGLAHPGHYRVLFSAMGAGPAGIGLPPGADHPGAEAFGVLLDAVGASLAPRTPGAAGAALLPAATLWAALHGIVDLRITKPELPWPDADQLVELALAVVGMSPGSP